MKKFAIALLSILIASTFQLSAQESSDRLLFSAWLNGNQQVPPVTTNAEGVASFALSADMDSICISVNVHGLSGPITGIHIHEGVAGTNGAPAFDLTDNVDGNVIQAVLTGADVNAAVIAKFLNEEYYVNVHTAANAPGEIRGQIKLESDEAYYAYMDAGQQVQPVNTASAIITSDFETTTDGWRHGNPSPNQPSVVSTGGPDGAGDGYLQVESNGSGSGGKMVCFNTTTWAGDLSGADGISMDVKKEMGSALFIRVRLQTSSGNFISNNMVTLTNANWTNAFFSLDPSNWTGTGNFAAGLQNVSKVWIFSNASASFPPSPVSAQLGIDNVSLVTNSAPQGVVSVSISQDDNFGRLLAVTDDLTDFITSAHFHYGQPGSNGGVAIDLSSLILDGAIGGTFDPTTPADFLDSLRAGSIYLNVHTNTNPGGEIRGNLSKSSGLAFQAVVDELSVAPLGIGAIGVAHYELNTTMDVLTYDFIARGLSGPINNIHIHEGFPGSNGGVLLDLSPGIDGNRVHGTITGGALTNDVIKKLLRGESYINVHTTANPGGEIRGNNMKVARDGYTFSLSGEQQVPPITVSGTGGGMVSISNREDYRNAHLMMSYHGLTGANTGVHFHNAPAGANGSVLFNLSSFFTGDADAASVYWTADDASPFDHVTEFWNEEVYVNIHTSANGGGELRGQVMGTPACTETSAPPACLQPTGVTVTPISPTSVTYSWDADSDAIAWQIQRRIAPSAGGGALGTSIAGAGSTSKVLNGLTAGTTYQSRIRKNCDNGILSPFKFKPFNTPSAKMQQPKVELFPNPVSQQLNIAVNSIEKKQTELQITDLAGRVVFVKTISFAEGVNQISLNLSSLTGGIYFVEIEGLDWVEKFVKN